MNCTSRALLENDVSSASYKNIIAVKKALVAAREHFHVEVVCLCEFVVGRLRVIVKDKDIFYYVT